MTTDLLKWDRSLTVGVLCGLLVGLTLTFGLAGRTGSTSTLVHFAPPHTNAALAPPSIQVLPENRGYDGQFYYRLALEPLSTAKRVDGVRLDHPALRMTRIGYPMAARAMSFGPLSLVDSMLAVNALSFAAIAAAGMLIARAAGRCSYAGLSLIFVPAFIYGTTMSVADTLAGALLLLGIAFFLDKRYVPTAALFTAAALTRETALLLPVVMISGILLARLRGRQVEDEQPRLRVAMAPLAAVGLWQVVVAATWGEIGLLSSGTKNLTVPLLGPFVTDRYFHPTTSEEMMNILVPAAAALIVVLSLVALIRGEVRRLDWVLVGCFIVAAVIAASIGPALLATYRNSVRGMGDATMFGGIAALHGRGGWSRAALVILVVVGLGLMLWEIRIAPDLS